jgi:acetyltransferase-like isoleucine patch superfamily enzyme
MTYRNRPIRLEDGAWVGAQVFVGPGVTVGSEAVISAGSIVTRSQPPEMVCAGNPCSPIRSRWPRSPEPHVFSEPAIDSVYRLDPTTATN